MNVAIVDLKPILINMSQQSHSDAERSNHNSDAEPPQMATDVPEHFHIAGDAADNVSENLAMKPGVVDTTSATQSFAQALQETPFWPKFDASLQDQINNVAAQFDVVPNATAESFNAHLARDWEATWS